MSVIRPEQENLPSFDPPGNDHILYPWEKENHRLRSALVSGICDRSQEASLFSGEGVLGVSPKIRDPPPKKKKNIPERLI